MILNSEFKEDSLRSWPASYYSLEPSARLFALQEQLHQHPDSRKDLRRLELFHKRWDASFHDQFLNAWMMLWAAGSQPVNFLNRARYERDVHTWLEQLCLFEETDDLLKEEWKNFADSLISSNLSSSSYRTAAFGVGHVSDRTACLRLASEIFTVTKTVPERTPDLEAALPLRSILLERYEALVPDGASYLAEVQSR
ncbi:MAG: hypothetical protein IJ225_01480 [Solobacterium sp.]|nr:hypothetical protein [Solobacterium sp.]